MEGAVLQDVRSSLEDCQGKVRTAKVAEEGVGGDAEAVDIHVTTHEGGQLWVRASERGYRVVQCSDEDGASVSVDRDGDVQFESLHTLLSRHSKAYRDSFAGQLGDALAALAAAQGSRRSSSSGSGDGGDAA